MKPNQPQEYWNPNSTERKLIKDKNGKMTTVFSSPWSKQEDAQRYQREKGMQTEGTASMMGNPTNGVVANTQPIPHMDADDSSLPSWLSEMMQNYSQELPMRLSLDKNAPAVTTEMLMPTDEQLASLQPIVREGIARVFLTLATKMYADNDLEHTTLIGTKLRGYLPADIMRYYQKLRGGTE